MDFGQLAEVERALGERLGLELARLLEADVTPAWSDEIELALRLAERHGNLEEDIGLFAERVAQRMPDVIASHPRQADTVWALVSPHVAETDFKRTTQGQLLESVEAAETAARETALAAERASLLAAMQPLLDVSCLRLDMPEIARVIAQTPSAHRSAIVASARDRADACLQRLAVVDNDQAVALRDEYRGVFGESNVVEVDPCAGSVHSGDCRDSIRSGDGVTPALVVVPAAETFAISKYEISWKELNPYCRSSTACQPHADENLPVAGVGVDLIEAFAGWLSRKTGFTYRLPTLAEWSLAAQGEPDPNRNCRVEVGGVRRGDTPIHVTNGSGNALGLVHVLGNVREVVRGGEGFLAVGGGFEDGIESCIASNAWSLDEHNPTTGFRLVREVS